MKNSAPTSIHTVSIGFIEDWITALRGCCAQAELIEFLKEAGLGAGPMPPTTRITLDQIVRLYQIAAVGTGDEMMGLWGRPIRPRALQHLLTTAREASDLPSALYRFSTFWNLLLDDFQFEFQSSRDQLCLSLVPQNGALPQRFGHMLVLKLAHGLVSWLAGQEVPVLAVDFAFDRPDFAEDYPVLFPAPVRFSTQRSAISFDPARLGLPVRRDNDALMAFLQRAPRDWIFTGYHEHNLALRIREDLYRFHWKKCRLEHVAQRLQMTPRTLMRRLDADGTSFQTIKDGLRRDLAIRDLQQGEKAIEQISQDVGFSSAANFHRAFRRWTGGTPSAYRRKNERREVFGNVQDAEAYAPAPYIVAVT
ncbi:MAG: AraC family transcriptional regulator ligand-binding domain-containing protein [Halocynthiibacter sp.]